MPNSIWNEVFTVDQLNAFGKKTIHESLGIEFTDFGNDYLEAKMPVDHRTHNPPGLLHGGASVVLAESLGSVASVLVVGVKNGSCVGVEINASHLQSIQTGFVIGRVTPIRIGKTLHVWNIQIRDGSSPQERLICQSRLSVMVLKKK